MLLFQPAPVQSFVRPTSFSGIYSEDDYVNAMAQRAAHEYALAHARVQAIERQRDHHHCHRHPHRHQSYPGSPYMDRFAPASLHNFSYGFGPAPARPAFLSPNRHASTDLLEEIAHTYTVWQEEERWRALNRRREAIVRQRELTRERAEAQRRRALAEAAAREHRTRVAHAAGIQARQAHDEQVLLSLMGQLGLSVAPGGSAPAAPQANKQECPLLFIRPVTPEAAPLPKPCDRKGKGRAAVIAVETPSPISRTIPVASEVQLKEELQARILTETDPETQESLDLLYSDLFDTREPTQPAAGPSRQKHVSFAVPISSVSTSACAPSSLPSKADEKAAPVPFDSPKTAPDEPKAEGRGEGAGAGAGAHLHRTPTLPPATAAKLLKFYRARRARKLSLAHIKDVEDALRKLEGAFAFPTQLDFVGGPPSRSPSPARTESDAEAALAYTTNNAPVHAYEQALNELLTKLDAVESNGDMEVRGRRKEVVIEVERALEAMERHIEESRERSRERARRGSVGSQASDPSINVTPHTVDSVNLDGVKVAVVAEEIPVEVPAEVEEPHDASATNEHALVPQVNASQVIPAASSGDSEATLASSLTNSAGNEHSPFGAGIPDSGADYVFAPSGNAIATHVVPPAVEVLAVPSIDCDAAATNENVGVTSQNAQSGAVPIVAGEAELVFETRSPLKSAKDLDPSIVPPSPPTVVVPEAITYIEPTATDATSVTDDVDVEHAPVFATLFTAGTAAPSEPESTSTQPPALAPAPNSSAPASSPDEETVFLPSRLAEDDGVERAGEDELRSPSNGSDWVDVGSETDL